MCQSRKNNERIYKLHERCLRIMHWYFVIFWQTLEKTMALFPRTTETFWTGLSKSSMSDLFKMKSDPCYNLRNNGNFHIPSVNTVFNSFLTEVLTLKKPVHSFTLQIEGLVSIHRDLCHERVNDHECISFLKAKIWNLLPYELKSISNLEILKNQWRYYHFLKKFESY